MSDTAFVHALLLVFVTPISGTMPIADYFTALLATAAVSRSSHFSVATDA